MKLKIKKPFLAKILKLKFKEITKSTTIMVWGNTSYGANKLSADLIKHELTHIKQQRGSKLYGLWWWFKYVVSVKFRLSQEIEAYRNQYQCFCRNVRNESQRREFLELKARDLSGEMYNNSITFEEALKQINETSNSPNKKTMDSMG